MTKCVGVTSKGHACGRFTKHGEYCVNHESQAAGYVAPAVTPVEPTSAVPVVAATVEPVVAAAEPVVAAVEPIVAAVEPVVAAVEPVVAAVVAAVEPINAVDEEVQQNMAEEEEDAENLSPIVQTQRLITLFADHWRDNNTLVLSESIVDMDTLEDDIHVLLKLGFYTKLDGSNFIVTRPANTLFNLAVGVSLVGIIASFFLK
jgi:hypothetical protein